MDNLTAEVQQALGEVDKRAAIAQKQYPYGFALPREIAQSLSAAGVLSTSETPGWIYKCCRILDLGMLAEYLCAWQIIETEFKIGKVSRLDAHLAIKENAFDLIRRYFPMIGEAASKRTDPEKEFLDIRKKLYF